MATYQLQHDPNAGELFNAAQNYMLADSAVLRIGELQAYRRTDIDATGWSRPGERSYEFDVDAVYRDKSGIVTHGTLVCAVRRCRDGQITVELAHR